LENGFFIAAQGFTNDFIRSRVILPACLPPTKTNPVLGLEVKDTENGLR